MLSENERGTIGVKYQCLHFTYCNLPLSHCDPYLKAPFGMGDPPQSPWHLARDDGLYCKGVSKRTLLLYDLENYL